MDVLIKGMEMPKTCKECKLMKYNCECAIVGHDAWEAIRDGRKYVWCPLEEVPTIIEAEEEKE